ncbi:hypothetical protein [Frondihabitans peucedani]
MTIDSCIEQPSGTNALVTYFDAIGVDISTQVKLVVGTHAHDDHIAGIGDLFKRAKEAKYVQSAALTSDEFFASVAADEDIERVLRQSVRSEFRAVVEELNLRSRPQAIAYATAQKTLWEVEPTGDHGATRVIALSPSDVAQYRSNQQLAAGMARAEDRMKLRPPDPNEASIALWLELGSSVILLGADLIIGPEGCGWKGILDGFDPQQKASLFKVPHHGSPNAHHEPVWSRLLETDPVALIAPFRPGRNPRPSSADVARILSFTPHGYTTAPSRIPVPSRSAQSAGKSLETVARNVRQPWGRVGHVQARRAEGASGWTVRFKEPARHL